MERWHGSVLSRPDNTKKPDRRSRSAQLKSDQSASRDPLLMRLPERLEIPVATIRPVALVTVKRPAHSIDGQTLFCAAAWTGRRCSKSSPHGMDAICERHVCMGAPYSRSLIICENGGSARASAGTARRFVQRERLVAARLLAHLGAETTTR